MFDSRTASLSSLLELVIDHRGKTPKKMGFEDFHDSGYLVLSAKHVKTDGLVNINRVRFANEEMYRKWMKIEVQKGDIVLTSEAPMGEVFYIDDKTKYVLGQRVFGLRPKQDLIEPLYLLAWLTSRNGQKQLNARASGSTVLGIKQSELLKIGVDVPPIKAQKIIAKTRYDFSKKIELNRQTNQTLEAIAQAIFKSWFVDFDPTRAKLKAKQNGQDPERAAMAAISGKTVEQLDQLSPEQQQQLKTTAALFPDALKDSELGEIPEGWEVKALDEIAHYQNGLALQKFRPEGDEQFLPVLKIAELKKGFADGKEKARINIKPECIVTNGDVVFSWSGSLIVDVWCGGKAALNQHLFRVTSSDYPKWFYYSWTKHHLAVFRQIAADKAVTMGHIKKEHLSQAKCITPNCDLSYFNILKDLLEKQIEQRIENFTLQEIRDSLLPKLLSGELCIPDAEKFLGNLP